MAGKTPQECLANIDSELAALRSHFGEEAEESPEMEQKMVGRGRKRRQSVGFKKQESSEDDEY